MTQPTTAREALIVEALGDVAALLEQVERLRSSMEATERALTNATAEFNERLRAFDAELASIAHRAKIKTVEHVARHVQDIGQHAAEAQARGMSDAARVAFAARLDPTLDRIGASLLQLVERLERPWDRWLAHAASAAGAAALTWIVGSAFPIR